MAGAAVRASRGLRAAADEAAGSLIEPDDAVSMVAGADRGAGRRSAGLRAVGATGWLGRFGLAGGWAAAEVAVAEAVAVALEAEDFGVVDEPVDHGGGDDFVAEDLTPAGERFVAGDDQAGAFVAGADELEH